MCFEGSVYTKGFSTLLTCKWLLSTVTSFMGFQGTGMTKSFSTLLTYIGFFTTMSLYVSSKFTGTIEGFPIVYMHKVLLQCEFVHVF
jgi:hypothetical protein